MREKFCPSCGKVVNKFYDNLCEECFLKNISALENLPTKLVVKTCKFCGKIYADGEPSASTNDAVNKSLAKLLPSQISSANYRISDKKIYISANVKIKNLQKKETKVLNFVEKVITCKFCSLKNIGYYQTVLQLRGPTNVVDKMLDEIKNQINILNQHDNYAFISKFDKVTNGFDVYTGSKSAGQNIANMLRNKFRANVKISRKLSGSISGKRVYRNTILVSVR